jgi:hypothetical protein
MPWTDRQTILSETGGVGSFDSMEFTPAAPAAGNELSVYALLADNKLQNPATRFTVQLWRFDDVTNQFAKVSSGGFVGGLDVAPGSRPGVGIDEPYWGKKMKVTVSKESNEELTLKLREGYED